MPHTKRGGEENGVALILRGVKLVEPAFIRNIVMRVCILSVKANIHFQAERKRRKPRKTSSFLL